MFTAAEINQLRPTRARARATVLGCLTAAMIMVAGACGSATPSSGGAPPSGNSSSSAGNATLSPATVIHVVITGGAVAGTYDVQSATVTCSRTSTDKTFFGNQYSDPSNAGLSSLQLIVQDAAAFTGGGTHFTTTITIKGQDLNIQGLPNNDPKGSGTVAIQDSGATATVTIKGQAAEGSAIDATIHCNQVVSLG
jgi:hypothetical protein